jgi:mono/diheme cytochrome c family protein
VSGGRKRRAAVALVLVLAGAAAFVVLTQPERIDPAALPARAADLANGERIYHAASCGYCHRAHDAPPAQPGPPTGGAPFPTPVGTFHPGNLTPDRDTGIGAWTEAQFVDALVNGTSPDGRHYFPAFPYASFRGIALDDVRDLRAYLMSLEPARGAAPRRPTVPLEPLARRGVGLWKRVGLDAPPSAAAPRSPGIARGEYLVNGPGHCGECHTPRDWLMRIDARRRLAGAAHPAGEGQVPSLRGLVKRRRYRDASDLVLALQEGETLGYDKLSSGGMGAIQANLARLPESDLQSIAQYLLTLE